MGMWPGNRWGNAMRRAHTTVLMTTVVAAFAMAQTALAADPAPTWQVASYSTTERPEAVRECLLLQVAGQTSSRPTAIPSVVGQWEIEFQYRGLPTRIVVEETGMNGARVIYPKALAWSAPDVVEACG